MGDVWQGILIVKTGSKKWHIKKKQTEGGGVRLLSAGTLKARLI
jgi:hypothetical protein